MADESRIYANTVCPYCSGGLAPLPKAKKRCPACGEQIHVRSGPDGHVYLLQEGDLHVLEEAWVEHRQARDRTAVQVGRPETVAALSRTLREIWDAGWRVQIVTDKQSCAECRKFRSHVYDPVRVPILPNGRCRNEFCRCEYLPAPP
jgi:hypothetical protein